MFIAYKNYFVSRKREKVIYFIRFQKHTKIVNEKPKVNTKLKIYNLDVVEKL